MNDEANGSEKIPYRGKELSVEELLAKLEHQREEILHLQKRRNKAIRRCKREEDLKPYQAELIRLQQHLEETRQRMIILFEGRDAAGKGGTIRRAFPADRRASAERTGRARRSLRDEQQGRGPPGLRGLRVRQVLRSLTGTLA